MLFWNAWSHYGCLAAMLCSSTKGSKGRCWIVKLYVVPRYLEPSHWIVKWWGVARITKSIYHLYLMDLSVFDEENSGKKTRWRSYDNAGVQGSDVGGWLCDESSRGSELLWKRRRPHEHRGRTSSWVRLTARRRSRASRQSKDRGYEDVLRHLVAMSSLGDGGSATQSRGRQGWSEMWNAVCRRVFWAGLGEQRKAAPTTTVDSTRAGQICVRQMWDFEGVVANRSGHFSSGPMAVFRCLDSKDEELPSGMPVAALHELRKV